MFANPLSSQSAGVVTLVKASAPATASRLGTAPEGGRLLDVVLTYAGLELSLLTCYAPCRPDERPAFFSGALAAALPPDRPVMACGDWNFVPGLEDVAGAVGAQQHRLAGGQEFEAVQVGRGLVDVWRHLHPEGSGITHVAANGAGASGARLDRWYVSAQLLPWVRACEVVHGLPGDHLGVELTLAPPVLLPCGPGRWRLPLHLLEDRQYCEGLAARVPAFLATHPVQEGAFTCRQRWDELKACLTTYSMAHTLQARQAATLVRRQLLRAVEAAQRAYSAHPSLPGVLQAYRAAQQRLQDHGEAEAAKRTAAAAVLWHCYGERPTQWFHNLGRQVMLHQPIPAVLDPGDREAPPADLSTPAGIQAGLQHAAAFFSADSPAGLFRPVPTDPAAQAELLAAVDMVLSPAAAKATLGPAEDGSLAGEEVAAVFPALPRGVSPGMDGLPYEFYIHFWGLLEVPFMAMVNEALHAAEGVAQQPDQPILPPSMLVGLIVLIFKGGAERDVRDLASYRPITLLNCDYRLLARTLCARLAPPLGSVVDATQTAFLPGRWIGDNVLFHLEEVQYLVETGGEGCVVLLDFEKAYDRCVRGWIYQVMERMGFPEPTVRWVRLMLAGTMARVSLNGHYTAPFPVRCSVQQGSPLSVLLYNITVQPMAAHLRQQQRAGQLHAIPLPDASPGPTSHQHADDTSLHLRAPCDVAVALSPGGSVGLHCLASGARLNQGKCKGLRFGPHPELDLATRVCGACGVRFPPAQEPLRHLGIFLSTDLAAAHAKTFAGLLHGVRQRAVLWRQHRLSWLGRAYVAKQVLASMVSYHATFIPPPRHLQARLAHLISAFVAGASPAEGGVGGGGIGHPALHVTSLPWEEGGVAMVDPCIQAECLQAKVAARLLQPGPHPWKQLMARRLHRALPALGPAVVVSSLQVTARHLDGRLLAYVRGLQRTLPHRRVLPEALSTAQVRTERLFYNRQVLLHGQPLLPRDHPELAARAVWTVHQLASQVAGGLPSSHALQRVWDCLPACWRVRAAQPLVAQWELAAAAGLARVVATGQLYTVQASGALAEAAGMLAPPGLEWVPCCVVYQRRQGRGRAEEGAGSDSDEEEEPPVPLLVGPWSHVQVDPSAWGHGNTDLVAFTVKAAAVRRVQLRALTAVDPGWYTPGSGCRPKLWDPPPSAAGGSVARSGLELLESRWQHSFDAAPTQGARRGVRRPAAAEFEVGLLPCQRPGKRARLGVWDRMVEAEQQPAQVRVRPPPELPDDVRDAAAPGPPGSAERALWQGLRGADLPRDQYGTVYRLLHGSLYVGALLCHIHVLPREQACCTHPACQGALETLSHAFLSCPAVTPAAEWVCRVFGAVAGCAPPPASARVLLADDQVEWSPPATGPLWLALRAAFLHAVWQLRCKRSLAGTPFSAAGVCAAVLAAVTATIRRDWARASQNLVRLSGACPEWFRGRSPMLQVGQFEARWAHRGVLCRVQREEVEGRERRQLVLRFSLSHPVPAPPHVPQAVQDGQDGQPPGLD
jgi:exonuclease III